MLYTNVYLDLQIFHTTILIMCHWSVSRNIPQKEKNKKENKKRKKFPVQVLVQNLFFPFPFPFHFLPYPPNWLKSRSSDEMSE